MCWSAEVSCMTAVVEWVVICILISRHRYPSDRAAVPFLASIACMETLEAALWLWGDLERWEKGKDEGCSRTNKLLTVTAVPLLAVQPWACMFLFRNTGDRSNRERLEALELAGILYFLASVALFMLSDCEILRDWKRPFDGINPLGLQTCTYITHYLHWVWSVALHPSLPNRFGYFSLLLIGAISHKPFFQFGAMFLFQLFVHASLHVYFEFSTASDSLWCWSAAPDTHPSNAIKTQ